MATVYNNPGNIEAGQGYAGETGETYGGGRFAVFKNPEMGLRALAYDLRKKMGDFDGDVRQMIAKYAPDNENKTKKYINFVQTQIGSNKITEDNLAKAVAAVIKMENSKKTQKAYFGDDLNDFSKLNEAIELSKIELGQDATLSDVRKVVAKTQTDDLFSTKAVSSVPVDTPPIVEPDKEKRVVGKGDTLNKIAKEYGMSPEEVLVLNPDIQDRNIIKLGQEITVNKKEPEGFFENLKARFGFNEGGDVPMKRQMSMFEEGGLLQEGGTVDPESGNEVPIGSTQEEVRDDIPAQLSEGEFVMPADVVRYHGLDKMMALRDEAKIGLQRMDAMGQMGNADEATIPDGIPFNINDLVMQDEPTEFNVGGLATGQMPTGFVPPVQQQYISPYAIEERPAFEPIGEQPTFEQLMPTTSGTYTEIRTYVNDAGLIMNIPFVNGQPLYPIPAGYRLQTDVQTAPTQEATTVAAPAVQQEERDDSNREIDERNEQLQQQMRDKKEAARKLGYTKEQSTLDALLTMNPILRTLSGNPERGTILANGNIADGEGGSFDPITGKQVGFLGTTNLGKDDFEVTQEMFEAGITPASLAGLRNVAGDKSIRDVIAGASSLDTGEVTGRTILDGPDYQEDVVDAQVMGTTTPRPFGAGAQAPYTERDVAIAEGRPLVVPSDDPIASSSGGTRTATAGDIARLFGQETVRGKTELDPLGVGFDAGRILTPVEQRLSDARIMTPFDAPKSSVTAATEISTINPFGRGEEDYQKIGDDYFRIKGDGSLAADPATGLKALNLRNPDSPIVTRRTENRPTGEEISLPRARPSALEREVGARLDRSDENLIKIAREEAERQAAAEAAAEKALKEQESIAEQNKRADERLAKIAEEQRQKEIIAEQTRRQQSQTDTSEADKQSAKEGRGNIVTDSSGRPVTDSRGQAVTTTRGSERDRNTIERQADAMRREADRKESKPASKPATSAADYNRKDGGGGGGGNNDGCFAKGTLITMQDDSKKPVEQIDIGDEVAVGGTVFAVGRFLINNLYDYEGIKVSGTHMVNENDTWVRVQDSKKAKFESDDDIVVYIFGSENRRIVINNTLFTDYFEVTEQEKLKEVGDSYFTTWKEHAILDSEENVKIRNFNNDTTTTMAAE
tara:strand:+ start:546 stop:3950 length:3405 start_codon:yes stop_codon:yes gene_type:complete